MIGIAAAAFVALAALAFGFARDRSFFPTLLIVIAFYYVLFGVIDGSPRVIALETLVACAFIGLALWGFKRSLWLVVAGLFLHGVQDVFHGSLIPNQGVPHWWPDFCLSCDVAIAALLAWLLRQANANANVPVPRRPS